MDNIPSITSSGVGIFPVVSKRFTIQSPSSRICASLGSPISTAITESKLIPVCANSPHNASRFGVNHLFVRSSTSGFKFFIGDIRAEHVQHFKVSVNTPLFANKNSPVHVVGVHVPAFVPKRPHLARQPRIVRSRGNEPLVRFQLPPAHRVHPRLSLRTRRARRNRFRPFADDADTRVFSSQATQVSLSLGGMKQIRLKRSARTPRVVFGHPWVFSGEIETPPRVPAGEAVELLDARGHSLGSGIWNPASQIVWRKFSSEKRAWGEDFLAEALAKAVAKRAPAPASRRLVWSEADALPGLVVDRFEDALVVQTLTAGADKMLPFIAAWLDENLSPSEIIFRNDAPSRRFEGLELSVSFHENKPHVPRRFDIEGVRYFLDLAGGQKTGFYLDQREQHVNAAKFSRGKSVLDACCNQGGFSFQCARAGAAQTLGIDVSAPAIEVCRRNAAENGFRNCAFETANLFDWFGENRERRFDLIVLDPPPFARTKDALAGALRGYKELNLRALKMLNPGGVLTTYSCSQRVGTEKFIDVLSSAAHDARRRVTLLEITGQPEDHPALLNFPESRYLKGLILRAD